MRFLSHFIFPLVYFTLLIQLIRGKQYIIKNIFITILDSERNKELIV